MERRRPGGSERKVDITHELNSPLLEYALESKETKRKTEKITVLYGCEDLFTLEPENLENATCQHTFDTEDESCEVTKRMAEVYEWRIQKDYRMPSLKLRVPSNKVKFELN